MLTGEIWAGGVVRVLSDGEEEDSSAFAGEEGWIWRIGDERESEWVTRSRIGAVGEDSSRVWLGLANLGEEERFEGGGSLNSAINNETQIGFSEELKEKIRSGKLGFSFWENSRKSICE